MPQMMTVKTIKSITALIFYHKIFHAK